MAGWQFLSTAGDFMDLKAKVGLGVGLALGLVLFALPIGLEDRLTREGGLIENASSLLLVLVVLICARQIWRNPSWLWISGFLGTVWMCLRELDFQRRFTTRSIESLGFFSSPGIELETKLVVGAALTPFVIAGAHLLLAGWRALPGAFTRREKWIGYLGMASCLVFVALLFEKVLDPNTAVVEELCELLFAYFIMLMVVGFSRQGRADHVPVRLKSDEALPGVSATAKQS